MARKSIDLTPRKTQQELLEQVTGRPSPVASAPPPPKAPLPPGVTGTPPLPPGRLVGAIAPSSLSPRERKTLEGLGWTEDVPIPANAADIVQSALQYQKEAEVVLPVDPRVGPLKIPQPQKLSSLPPDKQAGFVEALRTASAFEAENRAATAEAARDAALAQAVPGLAAAQAVAKQAAAAAPSLEIVDDIQPEGVEAASATPAPVPAQPQAQGSETGARAQLMYCPHCDWDLSQPGTPEPTERDKASFVHALLGGKVWQKTYQLFGGRLEVAFRTLTVRELELCYKQTYRDKTNGKFLEQVDFWEAVNRYRLVLQLLEYRPLQDGSATFSLPDGYSKDTNIGAEAFWELEPGDNFDHEGTRLPLIEKYVLDNVLGTEMAFRTVSNTCQQFNRAAAKMEAMADNTDFWQPTEVPS